MKSDEIIIQMLLNHGVINGALSWFVDNVRQGVLCCMPYMAEKHTKLEIFPLLTKLQG